MYRKQVGKYKTILDKSFYTGEYEKDDDNQEYKDEYEEEAFDYDSQQSIVREEPKVGRNDPCPCGSGKKYKKCCGK